MASAKDDGPTSVWRPGDATPEWVLKIVESGEELHAHNAEFEQAIWSRVCVRKYGWPSPALRQWHCTAARVAACSLPRSLGSAAQALGLAETKDAEGRRLMLRLCKPKSISKTGDPVWETDPALFARLEAYCEQDVRTERAIHNATPGLHPDERIAWLCDQKINQTGIPIDREFAAAAVKIDNDYKAVLEERLKALMGDTDVTGGAIEKIRAFCGRHGCRLPDLTKATVEDALHHGLYGELPTPVRQALELRVGLSRASVSKYQAMIDRTDADGRLRGAHVFYGANTGRWAAAGVQTHNLVRGRLKGEALQTSIDAIATGDWRTVLDRCGDVSDTLAYNVRSAIRAPRGKRLLVSDFASIECCVLAWLAGQSDLVDMLHNREDVYLRMAERINGAPANSFTAKTHGSERQLGKAAILGFGYGMGSDKFATTCKAMFGLDVDAETAAHTKKVYRDANYMIVRFWRRVEDAARDAINGTAVHSAGRVAFQRQGDYLVCQLPSSRVIRYYRPAIITVATEYGDRPTIAYQAYKKGSLAETLTYGGKLVENITQGVARDIMRDSLFRLLTRGFRVVMHVHDEIVTETDKGDDLDGFCRTMAEVNAWAHGCPVRCEGFATERYRK